MNRMRRLTNHMAAPLQKPIGTNLINQQQILSIKNTSTATSIEEKNNNNNDKSVIIEEISGNYLVTLNREKALNSLNIDMINILQPFYESLISLQKECTVIVKGAGSKAFCAGGDVRHLYDLGIAGNDINIITEFFDFEYKLDNLLATLPSYIHNISLLNGVTMGGGVGISVHGKYRIATNNTLFAMPETGIGFYTDVGGSYFLPRLIPNGLGLYLGLNGYRLKGSDVLHSGVATHYIDENNINNLVNDILYNNNNNYKPDYLLSKYSIHQSLLPEFTLKNDLNTISDIFSFSNSKSIEDIMIKLTNLNNDFGINTLKTMNSVSPTSLKVVYRALYEGRNKSLRECLDMEFDIVTEFMRQHDFYEGIRAQLVDKDRNPKWNPSTLQEVTTIDNYFPNI